MNFVGLGIIGIIVIIFIILFFILGDKDKED